MPNLMQEHPGWLPSPTGFTRVMRSGATTWYLSWDAASGNLDVSPAAAGKLAGPRPVVDVVDPGLVAGVFGPLGKALAATGPVARVRNCDLWDAIGTAINRQVVTAGQARATHLRFCTAYGEQVLTPAGVKVLFPTAELPPGELVSALRQVYRIGPWTAGAAVADWSNDFTHYPYDDLAVRHWARTAAPSLDWQDIDAAFGPPWLAGAGQHLSALTLLTLAQGGARVTSEP